MPPPVKVVASLFGSNQKRLLPLVLDDTRDLLYTLSDTSEIKVWLVKEQVKLGLFRALSSLLQNLGHFTGPTDRLYGRDVRIVDLSVITATEGGKLNVMATTNTGCRLSPSAMRGYNYSADAQNPPSSMQVLHVRFPPKDPNAAPQQQQQQSGSTAMTQYSGPQQGSTDTSSRAITYGQRLPITARLLHGFSTAGLAAITARTRLLRCARLHATEECIAGLINDQLGFRGVWAVDRSPIRSLDGGASHPRLRGHQYTGGLR